VHNLPLVSASWLKIQKRRSRLLQPKKELKRISGARPPGIDGLRLDPSVPLPDNQRLHVLLFHSTRARLNCEIPIRENDNVRVGSGETTAEVALSLDGQERIVGAFAPDRPRPAKAPYLPAPWRGRFSDYRCHNDMWLPFAGEVGWEIDGVEKIYWQGRMERWGHSKRRRSAPCSGHLSQIGVVGQFDCGRMTGLNGRAGGAYLENEPRFVCAIDPRRIRLVAGLR
jgi:hypothetical protein